MAERSKRDDHGTVSERVLEELERVARSTTGTILLVVTTVVLAASVAYADTLRLELLALFAAVAYLAGAVPGRRGPVFLAILPVVYLIAAMQMASRDLAEAVVGTAAIGAAGLAGGITTRVNRRHALRFERAAELAERRAQLLEVAVLAGRSMQQVSTHDVLRNLVIAATGLGWEAAALYILDHDRQTSRCDYAIGLPGVQGTVAPLERGIVKAVVAEGQLVAVDYQTYPDAIETVRALGLRATVAVPVVVDGTTAAVLTVASRRREETGEDEKETLQLIASHAGSALRVAGLYANEHQARERLEHLDRLQDDFISTASHELRTPLTIVRGASEILDARWDEIDEATKRTLAQRISGHAKDMARLVDRLLQFHELDVTGAATLRRPVALGPLVESAVRSTNDLAEDRIVNWRVGSDLVVEGDAEHLRWALTALLDNACRHTPAGTIITIEAHRLDVETVEVAVTDDGRGIPDEVLAADAGARFRRGGDVLTRDTRGIGLGLPTVRRVARRHGSELRIESEPGRGTRVSIRLPVYADGRSGVPRVIVLDDAETPDEADREPSEDAHRAG
jgi:signal transduction histidine kinase